MEKTVFYSLMIAAAFISAASSASNSCGDGNLCAIVCVKPSAATPDVHFAAFAELEGNRVHRSIIERLGLTPDEQIRERIVELSEADHYASQLFDGAMEHVKRTSEFVEGRSQFPTVTASYPDQSLKPSDVVQVPVTYTKSSCDYRRLADYSASKHAFIVDQDLYSRMNATDRAGFWSDLAFTYIAKEHGTPLDDDLKAKTAELVNQLFYGNEEDYDRVKRSKTEPMTKTERLDKIRELLKPVVPQNSEDEDS